MSARLQRFKARTNNYTLTPSQYTRIAWVALGALTLIVMTGAAVRLTGSGLGCPEWPKCYGKLYPPLSTHALIEFSNRTLTVPVTIAAGLAWLAALRRRPYRKDLARFSFLLPLGVVAQAILGGLTVEGHLAYGWVMAHFCLSMLILVACWQLVWRASHERDGLVPQADRRLVWLGRALVAAGALTIFAGTAATAAGPHSGGEPGQPISRLNFEGAGTLAFVVHRHAEVAILFGLLAVAFWWFSQRWGAAAEVRRAATLLAVMIGLQGLVGAVQYETHLPAGLVWVHVAMATLVWIATLRANSFASATFVGHREPAAQREVALAGEA